MGSFNTTCAISKAPILVGQEVRVFFLVWNCFDYHHSKNSKGLLSLKDMGSSCYPYDKYTVIGYPLLATYEDYNNYSFIDKDMEELTLNYIRSIYKPNVVQDGFDESDYNEYHDYLNIETIKDMKQLQDIEHSGALRVRTAHGDSFIAKMAIHEDIYQNLILKQSWKDYHSKDIKNFDFLYNHFKNQYLSEDDFMLNLSKGNQAKADFFREMLSEDIGKEKNGKIVTEESVEMEVRKIIMRQLKSSSDDSDPYSRNDWLFHKVRPASDILKNKDNPEFAEQILKSFVGGILTNKFFFTYNLEFDSVMTSGQCYNYKTHANMLSELSDIVKNLKSRWHDEEEFTLTKEKIVQEIVSVSFKDMDSKISDWFTSTDKEYIEYQKIISNIKDNNIESFVVGDKSDFDIFAKKYEVFSDVSNGLTIVFKE